MNSPLKEKILAAYETLAERYNALIEHKPHNAYYDRPNTLSLLPDVNGKKILDAGCGPGKYAEILLERGATVEGFDLSPKMVAQAQKRNPGRGHFFIHDLSNPLTRFASESFDIVLCALALDYIEDWTPPVREFHRLLKPGGIVVFSTGHPFFEFTFNQAKNYFVTEAVKCTWRGFGIPVEVNSYRRPLGDAMAAFTENGFFIDKLLEPLPVPEFANYDARHYKELSEFPSFICIRAQKRS